MRKSTPVVGVPLPVGYNGFMDKKPRKIDPDDPLAQHMLDVFLHSDDPFWVGLRERLFKAELERRRDVKQLYEKWFKDE